MASLSNVKPLLFLSLVTKESGFLRRGSFSGQGGLLINLLLLNVKVLVKAAERLFLQRKVKYLPILRNSMH